MKRFRSAVFGLLGMVGILCACQTLVYAENAQGQAKILNFEGQVKIKSPSAADWKAAQKGEWLVTGTEITTGANSSCEIGLGEGIKSAIKLRPDSKATLTSLDPVKVDIQSGKILSLVRNLKPGATFQVATPTAVAAARGTGWEEGAESIQVFEDIVHVTGSSGQENDIPEGKGIEIGEDGKLGEVFEVSGEAHSEWNEFKEDAQKELGTSSAEKAPESDKNDSDGKDHNSFGGDTHETMDTSSAHDELGGAAQNSQEDFQDIKTESTEQQKDDTALDDKLKNDNEPKPDPSHSIT